MTKKEITSLKRVDIDGLDIIDIAVGSNHSLVLARNMHKTIVMAFGDDCGNV